MGMYANYQPMADRDLEKDFSLDDVEDLQENEELEICNIDKMWDALHFLLTGRSAEEPIEGNLLSEAIVGKRNLSGEDGDEWIASTTADRVTEIAQALQEIDFETYLASFDRSAFSRNRIYPDIWEYEEEEEEIKEDLQISFETLKAFYEKMAARGSAVLVSIY